MDLKNVDKITIWKWFLIYFHTNLLIMGYKFLANRDQLWVKTKEFKFRKFQIKIVQHSFGVFR